MLMRIAGSTTGEGVNEETSSDSDEPLSYEKRSPVEDDVGDALTGRVTLGVGDGVGLSSGAAGDGVAKYLSQPERPFVIAHWHNATVYVRR